MCTAAACKLSGADIHVPPLPWCARHDVACQDIYEIHILGPVVFEAISCWWPAGLEALVSYATQGMRGCM